MSLSPNLGKKEMAQNKFNLRKHETCMKVNLLKKAHEIA